MSESLTSLQRLFEALDPERRTCRQIVEDAISRTTSLYGAADLLSEQYAPVTHATLSRWMRDWGYVRRWSLEDDPSPAEAA